MLEITAFTLRKWIQYATEFISCKCLCVRLWFLTIKFLWPGYSVCSNDCRTFCTYGFKNDVVNETKTPPSLKYLQMHGNMSNSGHVQQQLVSRRFTMLFAYEQWCSVNVHGQYLREHVSCHAVSSLLNVSVDMPFAFCTDKMKTWPLSANTGPDQTRPHYITFPCMLLHKEYGWWSWSREAQKLLHQIAVLQNSWRTPHTLCKVTHSVVQIESRHFGYFINWPVH